MKSGPEVERWVAEAAAKGTLDGTAMFTLDTASALAKLSNYQLPGPEYWLPKMVQAANAHGAEAVEIKLGRREVEVYLRGDGFPPAPEILRDVINTGGGKDHLVTALVSLTPGPPRSPSRPAASHAHDPSRSPAGGCRESRVGLGALEEVPAAQYLPLRGPFGG